MRTQIARRTGAIAALIALAALVVPWGSASAAKSQSTEPAVSSNAWYWQDQTSQPVTDPTTDADVVTLEATNPFCPQAPGGLGGQDATCKSGRLPVEVRGGDYETPNMLSAVGFDLLAVPIGSKVTRFTATFLEADDPQSQPINVDGKQLQACVVNDFFGDGEARKYKELPKFKCTKKDPIAKRKARKGKEGYEWTFDLTKLAAGWVKNGAPVTAVMLYPVKPKAASNAADDAQWRVVMAGKEEPDGIKTKLVYTPPPTETDDGLGGLDGDVSGGFDSGDTSTGGFDSGSGTTTGTTTETTVGEDTPTPVEADEVDPNALASDAIPEVPGGLPMYAWLAILGGFVGFSLVRTVVLEGATGVRPDGVLAQIRKINSERRGAPIEDVLGNDDGRLTAALGTIQGLGRSARSAITKLNPRSWRKS